jgi:hypothetical protein
MNNLITDWPKPKASEEKLANRVLTDAQHQWLVRGLKQPGGKLPLFDEYGQKVSTQTVKSCVSKGWAEPWFANPLKPDWMVCRLTENGRAILNTEDQD